jgi:hypothetical protein
VISAKDFEDACRVPVGVFNAVLFMMMLPINVIAMFALYTKIAKTFNPNQIQAGLRQKIRNDRPGVKRAW